MIIVILYELLRTKLNKETEMKVKKIIDLIVVILLFVIIIVAPSYATEGAPEIPAGFGPIVVSGIVLSVVTIKSFREKNLK